MTDAPSSAPSRRMLFLVIVLAALATVAIAALLVNIFERKQEARNPFYRVVELNDTIDDPAVWGKNFPMQYDLYLRTVDMQRTKYGGSEAMPHSPTQADPRSVVARSKLEQDPRLKTIWAGYSFSADTASAAAMPTCSMTRPSPSGRSSRLLPCASTATPPSSPPT